MADIFVNVLSASDEDTGTMRFSTQNRPSIGGACKFLEQKHQGFGRLESSAGVGIQRDDLLPLEAGTYTFKLTGTLRSPGGEGNQLVAD